MLAPNDFTLSCTDSSKYSLAGLDRAVAEVSDPAAGNVKNGTVNLQVSIPNVLDNRRIGHEDLDAGLDVHLGDADRALLVVADAAQLLGVGVAHRLEGREPVVEDAAEAVIPQGRRGAPAGCVAAEDHVFDFQKGDGVLDHGRRVDVGRRDDVGNVAVHKHVARLQAQDRRLGAARIGAT